MRDKHLTAKNKSNVHCNEIISYLSSDNAPEEIISRDYPEYVKNGLLMIHLALKVLSKQGVSNVSFSINYFDSLEDSQWVRKTEIKGEILFNNKRRFEDFKETHRFPSKIDYYFKGRHGYGVELNKHISFIKKIEGHLTILNDEQYNSKEGKKISISMSKSNKEYGFDTMAEQHNHFFSNFLQIYYSDKMQKIIDDREKTKADKILEKTEHLTSSFKI